MLKLQSHFHLHLKISSHFDLKQLKSSLFAQCSAKNATQFESCCAFWANNEFVIEEIYCWINYTYECGVADESMKRGGGAKLGMQIIYDKNSSFLWISSKFY